MGYSGYTEHEQQLESTSELEETVSKLKAEIATLRQFNSEALKLLTALTLSHTATSTQSDLVAAAIVSGDVGAYQETLAQMTGSILGGNDDGEGLGGEPGTTGVGVATALAEAAAERTARSKHFVVSDYQKPHHLQRL